MKILNKLQINPEKIIKNEELISLKGGYYTYECYLNGSFAMMMSSVQDNEFAASSECSDFYSGYGTCVCQFA